MTTTTKHTSSSAWLKDKQGQPTTPPSTPTAANTAQPRTPRNWWLVIYQVLRVAGPLLGGAALLAFEGWAVGEVLRMQGPLAPLPSFPVFVLIHVGAGVAFFQFLLVGAWLVGVSARVWADLKRKAGVS